MKTLDKEFDYTPARWRKMGRNLNEGGTHYDKRSEALEAFSAAVVLIVNKDTFDATLDTFDCESLEVMHPVSMESRILSIQFDEYHGYTVSLQHC